MKKIIICLIITAFSIQLQAQSFEKMLQDFSKAENVESVKIGKVGWNFLKMASIGKKDMAILRKISSVHVMDMSECRQEIKSRFAREVENLNDNEYELLLSTKDDEDEVLVLSKIKKDKIRELIIIDKNDPAIVRLKGKFDMNDLASASSLKSLEL